MEIRISILWDVWYFECIFIWIGMEKQHYTKFPQRHCQLKSRVIFFVPHYPSNHASLFSIIFYKERCGDDKREPGDAYSMGKRRCRKESNKSRGKTKVVSSSRVRIGKFNFSQETIISLYFSFCMGSWSELGKYFPGNNYSFFLSY